MVALIYRSATNECCRQIGSPGARTPGYESGLDKLDEPPSLIGLKTLAAQRLPRVELPELLLVLQFPLRIPHLAGSPTLSWVRAANVRRWCLPCLRTPTRFGPAE